jgi:hypothetical protein
MERGRKRHLVRDGCEAIGRNFFRSALKDVGRVFIVAVVLDSTYQLWILLSGIIAKKIESNVAPRCRV